MKIKLEKVRVELEVGKGKPTFYINGYPTEVSKEVAYSLLFGEDEAPPSPTSTTRYHKKGRGPQSAKSKRKLSASLKKYWKERKAREAQAMQGRGRGKKHLNGSALHN